MSMDLERLLSSLLYYLVLPFAAISFVLTPLTNDTRIFIGAAAIADNYYPLPYGWDAAYEVKPIMNRIVNWILYKAANTVVPMASNHYTEFGWIVKLTALIILIACVWYVSRKISFPYAFPFLFLSFVCMANFGILMSEWFAVMFSLVAVAMCTEGKVHYTFGAGVLMVCVGLLKSITSLMLIPVVCAVWLLNKKLDTYHLLTGCVVASCVFGMLCLTVWPYSIGDMLMSRLVAHVGMYDYTTILSWFWLTQDGRGFPQTMVYHLPIILIGIIAAIPVVAKYHDDYKKMGMFAAMWLIPIGIVLVQSEFIIYHYIVLVFPAIISVVLFRNQKFIVAAIIGLLISFILVNCMFGSFTVYEYTFWEQKEQNADSILELKDIALQPSLLYLDPGDAPYYFHANSSCHYITPMPVERNKPGWDLTYLPQYTETYNCIVTYQGKYIISDLKDKKQYFGEGILKNKTIMDMIERNYTKIDSQSWDIYKKNG